MILTRRVQRRDRKYTTTVYDEHDNEYDNVDVLYDVCEAEPDVGFAGGIEIYAIQYEDQGCIMDKLTERALDDLADEIGEYLRGYYEDEADYRYEQWRDRQLERD